MAQRRAGMKCYFCEQLYPIDQHLPAGQREKVYCHSCWGILMAHESVFHLTRERIRQLINRTVSEEAVRGQHITRLAALEQVRRERGIE